METASPRAEARLGRGLSVGAMLPDITTPQRKLTRLGQLALLHVGIEELANVRDGFRARRNISRKLRTVESNLAARTMFDTLSENCIFYISQLYEFSHRLGHSRRRR